MDRHQLPFCRAQTVAHTVSAGRAAADHGARLGAGRCNRLAGRQVTACHKDQLVHLRVGGKSRHTSFQHGFAAGQAVTEFIESHSAGSPRRHNDSADFYLGIFFHKMTPLADVFPRFAHKAWYCLSAPCSAAILLRQHRTIPA